MEKNKIRAKHYKVKIVKKSNNPFKFILSTISYALFIWLLLVGATLLIYVVDLKVKQYKGDYTPPKYNAYVVLTGSMLPKIQVKDVVVTKKIDGEELEEGDIITFLSSDERFEGLTVTHRIIEKYQDPVTGEYTYKTKGDNNNVADTALAHDYNVLGKVILKVPKIGYLQEFLATKGGWIIVILIPCLLVISYDIVKIFKTLHKKATKR